MVLPAQCSAEAKYIIVLENLDMWFDSTIPTIYGELVEWSITTDC